MKNIAKVAGKPLLAYSIEQARACHEVDQIVVSTDNKAIAHVAACWGTKIVWRPEEISGDHSASEDAIKHVLTQMPRPDIILFLQATSPIRQVGDIDRAVRMVQSDRYDSVLSVVRLHQFVWRDDGWAPYSLNYSPTQKRPMRQSVEEWVENGSIYCFKTSILEDVGTRLGGRIGLLPMSYWSRFEIDTQEDLEVVEWVMQKQGLT
jgi:N-acylneuraminate cytidylyltransferase